MMSRSAANNVDIAHSRHDAVGCARHAAIAQSRDRGEVRMEERIGRHAV